MKEETEKRIKEGLRAASGAADELVDAGMERAKASRYSWAIVLAVVLLAAVGLWIVFK